MYLRYRTTTAPVYLNYEDRSSEELLGLFHDETVHLFLREPMLLELARRSDPHVLDICHQLMIRPDIEKQLLALRALITFGSTEAIEALYEYYLRCSADINCVIASSIAQTVTEEYLDRFNRIVNQFVSVGILDITGWTRYAINSLMNSCRRSGITCIFESKPSNIAYSISSSTKKELVPEMIH